MGCFEKCTAPLTAQQIDRSKHVNFVEGMILGVDEFTQEFAYLSGRNEWLARDTIGYGTVCGLRVSLEKQEQNARIVIERGNAITPSGKLIHVPVVQCSTWLADWLKGKGDIKEIIGPEAGSTPSSYELPVYVTLSYRDCKVDEVPVPGAPCRTEEDSTVPSRIADSFLLELRLEKPVQREEVAIRQFVNWLKYCIDITDDGNPIALKNERFIEEMKNSFGQFSSDIELPWLNPPSFPADTLLVISKSDIAEFMRTALRFWTTEIRPYCRAKGLGNSVTSACCGDLSGLPVAEKSDDDCVLLAEVRLPVHFSEMSPRGWFIDFNALNNPQKYPIQESERPILVNSAILKELNTTMGSISQKNIISESVIRQEFSVVAAGHITHDGTDVIVEQPSFNNVSAKIVNSTINSRPVWIAVTFDGYAVPDGTFNYSVRVLESSHTNVLALVSIRFDKFTNDGIVLRISRGSTNIQATDLDFLIEVNRYSAVR